jgi:hypothetical protein
VTQSSPSKSSNGSERVNDRHHELSWGCRHIRRFAAKRPSCASRDLTPYETRGSAMSFLVHSIQWSRRILPALLLLVTASTCSLDTEPKTQSSPVSSTPGGSGGPECTRDCRGRTCGDDGCEGSCGSCRAGTRCNDASGTCVACTASCQDRSCGDDACGGSCGSCENDTTCDEDSGTCGCVAECGSRECGPDGCGGVCGTCKRNEDCTAAGMCRCRPNCGTRQCGDDGCGGSCGTCFGRPGTACTDGLCKCVPDCDGGRRVCGSNGCEEGVCGVCTSGTCDNQTGLCRR